MLRFLCVLFQAEALYSFFLAFFVMYKTFIVITSITIMNQTVLKKKNKEKKIEEKYVSYTSFALN